MIDNENVNETLQNDNADEEIKAQTEETAEVNEAKEEKSAEPKQKKSDTKLKGELAKAEEKIKAHEAELEESRDKYLRLAAEYDNFRKRSAKEKDGIYSDAVADVVGEILPIFDNLERAAIYEDAEKVAQGLALTAKSAEAMLTKLSIEKFGAAGDAFDPNLHNAVMHCEDETLGESVVAEVFQCGYKKGDKVIRYAMVKVAN